MRYLICFPPRNKRFATNWSNSDRHGVIRTTTYMTYFTGVHGRNIGVRKQYTPYLLEKSQAGKWWQCKKALVSVHIIVYCLFKISKYQPEHLTENHKTKLCLDNTIRAMVDFLIQGQLSNNCFALLGKERQPPQNGFLGKQKSSNIIYSQSCAFSVSHYRCRATYTYYVAVLYSERIVF